MTETDTDDGYSLLKDQIKIQINTTDREIIPAVAGTVGLEYGTGDYNEDATDAANIIDNYNKDKPQSTNDISNGITNKFGTQVDEKTKTNIGDEKLPATVNEAYVTIAEEAANGRTIGKSAMYEGDVLSATALVDGVEAVMRCLFVFLTHLVLHKQKNEWEQLMKIF